MANVLTIRRGAKVRHCETRYNWWWGNRMETINEVVTIVSSPRDPLTGRYCRADEFDARVTVKPAKGDAYEVGVEHLEVYNTIWDLTRDELMQLRGQVSLGSVYLSDYRNRFNIDPHQVYDFCEGYGSSIGWDNDADTPEAFADYCEGVERYAA